ncbi:glycosyltransferase family 4 protein [Trichloromonas sp.]|uniref:glycosyltransferase family 4 protein n=1 Tax=Trichloromonas sp. TaxID=3069249 RepID=UPI003D8125F6
MAIQATKLESLFVAAGYSVLSVPTNCELPRSLQWVVTVPILRTGVNVLVFFYSLRRASLQADAVYFLTGFFNFFWWVTFPALLLFFMSGQKVILSARGGGAGAFFDRYRILLNPLMHRIDLITTPSVFLQQEFARSFGIRPEVVPNIADLKQFGFRLRSPLRPRLIVTRNLEAIYNVGCAIRAFARVRERYPDATLAVIGEGDERTMLESLASSLELGSSVIFYGSVPHDQIQAMYDETDIFINASNVDNLPGVILEAFACGLPVVTTRAGGIPFMVEDKVTALLVDCDDCDALAARVCELLEDPVLARRLSENGRLESHRYSPEQVLQRMVPMFERVIEGTRDGKG